MDVLDDRGAQRRVGSRVVKPAPVRRMELADCAERLFLSRGYEKTTVNDVIAATGVSKGAFYHHFKAKEDLLEAVTERFAQRSLAAVGPVLGDPSLDALQRLNGMLTLLRAWKLDTMPDLRAVFTALIAPDNAILYYRIAAAVFSAVEPVLITVIAEGQRQGVFDVADAGLAAETMLSLSEGRWRLVVGAMAAAERGDTDAAIRILMPRLRAEEAMIDRILGLRPGSISLYGSEDVVRAMLSGWSEP